MELIYDAAMGVDAEQTKENEIITNRAVQQFNLVLEKSHEFLKSTDNWIRDIQENLAKLKGMSLSRGREILNLHNRFMGAPSNIEHFAKGIRNLLKDADQAQRSLNENFIASGMYGPLELDDLA